MKNDTFRIYTNEMGTIAESCHYKTQKTDDDAVVVIAELTRENKTTGKIDFFVAPVVADAVYQFVKHADAFPVDAESKLLNFIESLYTVAFNADDDAVNVADADAELIALEIVAPIFFEPVAPVAFDDDVVVEFFDDDVAFDDDVEIDFNNPNDVVYIA